MRCTQKQACGSRLPWWSSSWRSCCPCPGSCTRRPPTSCDCCRDAVGSARCDVWNDLLAGRDACNEQVGITFDTCTNRCNPADSVQGRCAWIRDCLDTCRGIQARQNAGCSSRYRSQVRNQCPGALRRGEEERASVPAWSHRALRVHDDDDRAARRPPRLDHDRHDGHHHDDGCSVSAGTTGDDEQDTPEEGTTSSCQGVPEQLHRAGSCAPAIATAGGLRRGLPGAWHLQSLLPQRQLPLPPAHVHRQRAARVG